MNSHRQPRRSPGKAELKRHLQLAASTGLTVALCACSGLTDPYLSVPSPVPSSPTFAEAKVIARTANDALMEKLEDLESFDLATGTLLVGSGLAGVAAGLYDAGLNVIYGAGLAGGSAQAGRSFLPFQTRKEVYVAGSGAITCAITAISLGVPDNPAAPGTGVARASSATRVVTRGQLGASADALRRLAAGGVLVPAASGRAATPSNFIGLRARSSNMESMATLSSDANAKARAEVSAELTKALANTSEESRTAARELADRIDAAIAMRGERLLLATEAIVNVVNQKIVAAPITPEAALEAAQNHITEIQNQIKEKADETKDKADKTEADAKVTKEVLDRTADKSSADPDVVKEARDTAQEVETAQSNAESIQSQVAVVLARVEVPTDCLGGLR